MVIRESTAADLGTILTIVNDAAQAYRGVIPADRWHEPYMAVDQLAKEIADGTDASWAIEFYRRNGYTLVSRGDKDRLLRKYWSIPARQIETSVVLASGRWVPAS